jgi:hypothetical protein
MNKSELKYGNKEQRTAVHEDGHHPIAPKPNANTQLRDYQAYFYNLYNLLNVLFYIEFKKLTIPQKN